MRISENQKSVVMEGLLFIAVLTLLSMLLNMLIVPVEGTFGTSGLLVYTLVLLAVTIYSLDHALIPGSYETTRAWYGAIGGLLAWMVVALADGMGAYALQNISSVIWLLLVGLVVVILWQRVLPIGARFFFAALIMSWVARFLLVAQETFLSWNADSLRYFRLNGYLMVFGAVVALVWMILRARQRVQRMWISLWVWFFTIIALSVFFGRLI